MTAKSYNIKMTANLLTEEREESMIVILRRLAQELLVNATMITAGEKIAKPKVVVTVESFYDNAQVISIALTEEEVATADAENPFAM